MSIEIEQQWHNRTIRLVSIYLLTCKIVTYAYQCRTQIQDPSQNGKPVSLWFSMFLTASVCTQ